MSYLSEFITDDFCIGPADKDYVCPIDNDCVEDDQDRPAPKMYSDTNYALAGFATDINVITATGVNIDKVHYEVSAPYVPRKQPLTQSTLDLCTDSMLCCGTTTVRASNGGRVKATMTLTDPNSRVFFFTHDGQCLTPTKECYVSLYEQEGDNIEYLEHPTNVTYEDVNEQSLKDKDAVIVHGLDEYDVPNKKVCFLYAQPDGLFYRERTRAYARTLPRHLWGKICRVSLEGEILCAESDNRRLSSFCECEAIRVAPNIDTIKDKLKNLVGGYSMLYHHSVYIRDLFKNGIMDTTKPDNIARHLNFQLPYSCTELMTIIKTYVELAGSKKITFVESNTTPAYHETDTEFVVHVSPSVPLDFSNFYKSHVWRRNRSFSGAFRHLLDLGFCFTSPDLELLYKKFLRAYDGNWYFVRNRHYFPVLRPYRPMRALIEITEPPSLPYANALYTKDFFQTFARVNFTGLIKKRFLTFSNFRVTSLCDPHCVAAMRCFIKESVTAVTIREVCKMTGYPKASVQAAISYSGLFEYDKGIVRFKNKNNIASILHYDVS